MGNAAATSVRGARIAAGCGAALLPVAVVAGFAPTAPGAAGTATTVLDIRASAGCDVTTGTRVIAKRAGTETRVIGGVDTGAGAGVVRAAGRTGGRIAAIAIGGATGDPAPAAAADFSSIDCCGSSPVALALSGATADRAPAIAFAVTPTGRILPATGNLPLMARVGEIESGWPVSAGRGSAASAATATVAGKLFAGNALTGSSTGANAGNCGAALAARTDAAKTG